MPFLRALTLFEKQMYTTRIWTQVTNSIFYDDNRYTKHDFMM